MATQPNTGANHQYLRTRDRRLFFFFFLFNVGAAIISLFQGPSQLRRSNPRLLQS